MPPHYLLPRTHLAYVALGSFLVSNKREYIVVRSMSQLVLDCLITSFDLGDATSDLPFYVIISGG
jgi:hypothetical protein